MKKIMVTGCNGQLGRQIQKEYENEQWRYLQPPENEYKQVEEESSEIQSTSK